MAKSDITTCLVKCESCGEVVKAERHEGWFKKEWRLIDGKDRCPKCRERMDLSFIEPRECKSCGKLVEDIGDGRCINCHELLDPVNIRGHILCPTCGTQIAIGDKTDDYVVCPQCGKTIPKSYINTNITPVGSPNYIVLPDMKKLLAEKKAIWKHPLNSFPYQSRMQVNEGTYALMLQNGVCMEPCEPGDYLLQDTKLNLMEKLDSAMKGEGGIFRTDIYCILKDLPEFNIGCGAENIDVGLAQYHARISGVIALQVSDPKAFAEYVGYQEVTFDQLTKSNPDVGSTNDGKLLELCRGLMDQSARAVLKGMTPSRLLGVEASDMSAPMASEMNGRLAPNGLRVKELRIKNFDAKPSEKSNADTLSGWMEREITWRVPGVRVNMRDNKNYYAELEMSGICRLRVEDRDLFATSGGAMDMLEAGRMGAQAVEEKNRARIEGLLTNQLPIEAQAQVNRGEISDILDPGQYVYALQDRVRDSLTRMLRADGLGVYSLIFDMPQIKKVSDELSKAQDLPKRRQAIRGAVEEEMVLTPAMIRVHDKSDKGIYTKYQFEARAVLRVADERRFFELSEVQKAVEGVAGYNAVTLKQDYGKRLTSNLETVLGRIVQSVVDQVDADIRELERFTGLLERSCKASMEERVASWGLSLESVDLLSKGMDTAGSEGLSLLSKRESTETRTRLEKQIQQMENDQVIFKLEQDGEISIKGMEIREKVDAKARELAEAKEMREHERQIIRLQRGAELDELADEIAEKKKVRADDAILADYKRKYRVQQEKLEEQIELARRMQESQIEARQRDKRAEFEQMINEAENKHALNEIMRKIAESDLNWRQKLDEYDRIRKLADTRTDSEIRQNKSETDLRIERDRDEFYFQAGEKKIRLRAEEAELLEKIARYSEERRLREQQARDSAFERRAVMDFEQKMTERRERLANEMELLKLEYEHEIQMEDRANELEKLKAQLDYYTQVKTLDAGTRKAEVAAEANARIAEAQVALIRSEEQIKRQESIEQRAEKFREELLQIQKALEMTRLENERHATTVSGDVAIQTAAGLGRAQAAAAAGQQDQRIRDLDEKISRMSSSIHSMKDSIRGLRKTVEAVTKWINQVGAMTAQPTVTPTTVTPPTMTPPTVTPPTMTPPTVTPPTQAMMKCPQCHNTIIATALSCPICGAPVIPIL